MPSALVSGANGFIASHLVKQLIDQGYTVIGTVRKDESGKDLASKFPKNFSYEIVGSLEEKGVFDAVFKKHPEIEYFFHTASPAKFTADDIEKEIILPAISGTELAFYGALRHGKNLKHFTLTSSVVTLFEPGDSTTVVNEKLWNTLTIEKGKTNGIIGYCTSKKLAEKRFWELAGKEKPHFTVNTVLPPYVFGPQSFDQYAAGGVNLTADFIVGLLKLKEGDSVPEMGDHWADVRNVAASHVASLRPETHGKRLIVGNPKTFSLNEALNIINKNFPELHLPKGDPSKPLPEPYLDLAASNALLKIDYIPFEKTVTDAISQYLKVN